MLRAELSAWCEIAPPKLVISEPPVSELSLNVQELTSRLVPRIAPPATTAVFPLKLELFTCRVGVLIAPPWVPPVLPSKLELLTSIFTPPLPEIAPPEVLALFRVNSALVTNTAPVLLKIAPPNTAPFSENLVPVTVTVPPWA